MEMVAVPEADAARWSEWYGKERFPALLELPGVVAGGWFGITTEGWDEEPRYRYMTLFELEDEAAALDLGDPARRGPKAKAFWEDPAAKPYYDLAGDVLIDYYQPISKHWSFKKQAW